MDMSELQQLEQQLPRWALPRMEDVPKGTPRLIDRKMDEGADLRKIVRRAEILAEFRSVSREYHYLERRNPDSDWEHDLGINRDDAWVTTMQPGAE